MAAAACGTSSLSSTATDLDAQAPDAGASDAGASSDGLDGPEVYVPPCDDPLRTGVQEQDLYDCEVMASVATVVEPDPMMFKAMIGASSAFNVFAVSPDSPCGIRPGWTSDESKSFGLLQLTPACGFLKSALLPDGHPNLTMDMQSPLWATSVFEPGVNLLEGVRAIHLSRQQATTAFPGCTESQFTLMAVGMFFQGQSAILGCGMMSPAAENAVAVVLRSYAPLARQAGWPYPY